MSGVSRRAAFLGATLAALVAAGCGAPGPGPSSPEAEPPAVVAVAEPGATAVGIAVVVPGSGGEDGRTSGLTLLAAEALLEASAAELSALGARASVACGRWAFVFTLVAPPATWRAAAEVLARALARPEPSSAALERARATLTAALELERASPAWQSRLATGRALYGSGPVDAGGAGWSGPPCGVVETLGLFDLAAVRAAASRLGEIRSVAAVGSVDAADAAALAALFAPAGAGAPLPLPGPPSPGRVYVERNTVTAWVALAWPFGPGADPEAVGLLGAVLEETVRPGLSRPDILHVESEVERHGRGGALVVTVVARPEQALAVAFSLESELARVASGAGADPVLERVARRHRGERLRELAAPEARAARIAVARAAGESAGAWPAPGSWSPAAAREAARALGPAARAVVGPRAARAAAVP